MLHNSCLLLRLRPQIISKAVEPEQYGVIKGAKALIDELKSEVDRYEQHKERIDLLEKKQAWLVFDKKREEAKLAEEFRGSIKRHKQEVENMIKHRQALATVSSDIDAMNTKLEGIKDELNEAANAYDKKKAHLKTKLREAEALAPKNKWFGRLDQDDLPANLAEVEEALDVARKGMKTIKEKRESMQHCEQKKNDIVIAAAQLNSAVDLEVKESDWDLLSIEDTWVSCDACKKWRMLPPGISDDELAKIPDAWYCKD